MRLNLKPLRDQVVVVTGATSGIGLATARLAATRPDRTTRPDDWCDAISSRLGAPVLLESYGPLSSDKKLHD